MIGQHQRVSRGRRRGSIDADYSDGGGQWVRQWVLGYHRLMHRGAAATQRACRARGQCHGIVSPAIARDGRAGCNTDGYFITLQQIDEGTVRAFHEEGSDGMMDDMHELDRDRMVVLSLKPRFAEAILTGVKTVELRRTVPKIVVPTRALLYATTPVRALLGACVITRVASAELAVLWREYGSRSDLRYREFLQYFDGVDAGTALELIQPRAFHRQVSLQDLRAGPRGFRPPQSFAYVDTETGDQLMRLAA